MITVAEIIILIVGAILFTISFIIPDKGGSSAVVDADGYIDEDAIKKADELGITMLFTGIRHFKH